MNLTQPFASDQAFPALAPPFFSTPAAPTANPAHDLDPWHGVFTFSGGQFTPLENSPLDTVGDSNDWDSLARAAGYSHGNGNTEDGFAEVRIYEATRKAGIAGKYRYIVLVSPCGGSIFEVWCPTILDLLSALNHCRGLLMLAPSCRLDEIARIQSAKKR